jgi:chromosome segregation ATPase
MKALARTLPVFASALALVLAGCQSSGSDKSASTVSSLDALKESLTALEESVTEVVTSLETLGAGAGDMQAQFKAFAKDVDTVEKRSSKVKSASESLRKQRDAFMSSWEQDLATIENADLRERGMKRHKDAATRFADLDTANAKRAEAFDAWLASVKELRTYLSNDLNPAGIKGVSSTIKSISSDAQKIKKAADDAIAKLDKAAEAMRAAKPALEAGS